MSNVKERILGAVTVMSDSDAEAVWKMILKRFPSKSWDDIKEVEPDEWDKQMLKEIQSDPDCHEFVSEAELMKQLGIQ